MGQRINWCKTNSIQKQPLLQMKTMVTHS